MAYSFESLKDGYQKRWDAMRITRPEAIDAAARSIIRNLPRYQKISKLMGNGMPPALIGVIHLRESDLDFNAHLHNGDKPLSRPTRHVPAGRGPFATFEESAVDALTMEGAKSITDWSIPRQAWFLEKFNGFGYQNRSGGNPYLWGGTNNYTNGKYVRDGDYDASFHDPQLGVMPILKKVMDGRLVKEEVASNSSKATFLQRAQAFMVTTFGGLFSLSYLEPMKDIFNFVKENQLWFVLGGAVALFVAIKWLEDKQVEDFKEGRWTPSGMADQPADDTFTAKAKTDVDNDTDTESASAPGDPSPSTTDSSGVASNV